MNQERIIADLLSLLPYWHIKIDKVFKQSREKTLSLEMYYCLQTLRTWGPMTMSDLTRRMNIKKQQATELITKLYEHGMINRTQDEQDRRFVNIEVTNTAIKYIEEDYYHNAQFLQQLHKDMGEEDIEAFSEAVGTILRILSKMDMDEKI